jgi:hypothetical protein
VHESDYATDYEPVYRCPIGSATIVTPMSRTPPSRHSDEPRFYRSHARRARLSSCVSTTLAGAGRPERPPDAGAGEHGTAPEHHDEDAVGGV